MKYLIVQDWNSTHGNHAGMVHMCNLLVERWPEKYTKICKSQPTPITPRGNWLTRKINCRIDRYRFRKAWLKDYMSICQDMFHRLQTGDEVFLLEYNWPGASQYELAKYIRENYPGVKIRTLSHITPTLFSRKKANRYIYQWSKVVDTEMTMGSGLTDYLRSCGVPDEKLSTGFHYVDNDYYHLSIDEIQLKERPTIIAIGALQRDFSLLADIANNTPNVNWIICKGRKDVDSYFHGNNIRLVGFVPEDELRDLMRQSDFSINVLEDTVGSNVITTSLAMGLGLIVSDVGSIRDHVDDKCAVFCENTKESFIQAINSLANDPQRIVSMRKASLERVNNITIDKVNNWFSNL